MKSQNHQFHGIGHVLDRTRRRDGVRALYRGFGVMSAHVFVYRGLYFGLFETVVSALQEKNTYITVSGAAVVFGVGLGERFTVSGISIDVRVRCSLTVTSR